MGEQRIHEAAHIHVLFDHIVPANNSTTATLQHELREFARSSFLHFSDIGAGICHQIMSEGIVLPGEVVVGADSHSCTLGAFGAFATGVGATDMAAIWMTGETWFRVPESTGIHLSGTLTGAAEAKDLALTYVRRLGRDGASYQALEFIGEGTASLSIVLKARKTPAPGAYPELTRSIQSAVIGLLMSSAAKHVVVSQEDLLRDIRQQNVPGTIAEYPSWSMKMAYTVEELRRDSHVAECARIFRRWVIRTGRGSSMPTEARGKPARGPRR